MKERHFSLLDKAIGGFDRALRSLSRNTQIATKTSPADSIEETQLEDKDRQHSAGLMRVNHSGEVCAQALYQGQALTAKLSSVQEEMDRAAQQEMDHLAWCEDRLQALGSQPSILNPAWYAMSFSLGAMAGAISDRVSLGFVAATEERVCDHLRKHLEQLPEADKRSRAVVEQMLEDEGNHREAALAAGGYDFPTPVKAAMTLVSSAMTTTSYRI